MISPGFVNNVKINTVKIVNNAGENFGTITATTTPTLDMVSSSEHTNKMASYSYEKGKYGGPCGTIFYFRQIKGHLPYRARL